MTYIDSTEHVVGGRRRGGEPVVEIITHSWAAFTEARLRWLYGDNHREERAGKTATDLAAWRGLGSRDQRKGQKA